MPTPSPGRPRFLKLPSIRFPIGAFVSIGHRLSGVVLLIGLPFLAIALEQSLRSEADFAALAAQWAGPWRSLLLVIVVWAAAHHILAGVRHLLMDLGIGSTLTRARISAWATIVTAALIAVSSAARWLS